MSGIFTDGLAALCKDRAGEKYCPSNGSEGEMFMGTFCASCKRDAAFREERGDSCPIVAATFCYDKDDPRYPVEWQYDKNGQPTCTAYEEE